MRQIFNAYEPMPAKKMRQENIAWPRFKTWRPICLATYDLMYADLRLTIYD
jgi:hypothetical protein